MKPFFVSLFLYFFPKGEKKWLDLLELADQAIDGLPFHQYLPIIKECVHMCSYLYDKNILLLEFPQTKNSNGDSFSY